MLPNEESMLLNFGTDSIYSHKQFRKQAYHLKTATFGISFAHSVLFGSKLTTREM